ncbi:Oxidoreductase AflX [Cytospora mali]|uniref:Oxidoreductase AflX n=1 Tax=Cytospora mali TaxID=578113 RepID=A0A194V8F2_CYTMA|nr:Oxidoreductase AflX [Valsa mali var. pyri (nom. inval.)]
MPTQNTYAVLGSTGNCGTALIENLLKKPGNRIHAYCRNRSKLLRLLPDTKEGGRVKIFEGSIHDVELLTSCIRNCRAVFLVVSTNDNIPRCRVGQDIAAAIIRALQSLRHQSEGPGGRDGGDSSQGATHTVMPKLVLLSSGTIDDNFSRSVPFMLRPILHRSASHVYNDLIETEKLLRAQEDWLTTIYVKPGALSVDLQRGHALSLTDQDEGAVSYLDLAAAMIEAADDADGRYDMKNVSVVNTNGSAKFPAGTPLCQDQSKETDEA